MPDVFATAAALAAALAAPVLAWTALGVAVEVALRTVRPVPSLALRARGATLALLPALIVLPPLLAPLVPSFAAPAETVAVAFDAVPRVAVVAAEAPIDPWGVFGVVAGLASVLALVVLAGGVAWVGRARRRLPAAGPDARAEGRALRARLGVRRRVDVARAAAEAAPFTLGVRRPLVAVPDGLADEPLELALAHELAHVRRAHYGWHVAERAVCAAFVWHPLVHVLAHGLALDRERVADADVVRLWPERAARYGRLLADFATRPTPALALGASSSTLVPRLSAMARLRPDRPVLAALVGAALVAVPLGIAAAAVPDAAPPSSMEASVPAAEALAPAPAAADTTDRAIQTIQVRRGGGEARHIEVVMASGSTRVQAEAVADEIGGGDAPGTLVVIAADGTRITRSGLSLDALPPPPPAPPAPPRAPDAPAPPPAPPAPPVPAGVEGIESVSVRRGPGSRPQMEIRMKPGTTRAAAVAVADEMSAGDTPGDLTVIAADGERITRSTLAMPDTPPPPPAPDAPAPPPAPEPASLGAVAPAPLVAPTPPTPRVAPAPRVAPVRDSR